MAATPAMSGHAASVEGLRGLALTADALHILGVGAWLGTLVVLLTIAVLVVPLLTRRLSRRRAGGDVTQQVGARGPT